MPAVVQPYVLRHLRGRNGSTPENIDDGQFQELQNWYAKDRIIKRRKGVVPISGLAYSAALTGAAVYLPGGVGYKLLLGTADGLAQYVTASGSSSIVALSTSLTIATDAVERWVMQQYKNTMYALRQDIGLLYRSDGLSVMGTGIAAPATAMTAAEGAAGLLDAADYEAIVTFYNAASGAESNPSPEVTVTIGASKSINYSAIPTSTDPQVTARKIYRSLPDAQGEWFHVLTILDNVTTSFSGEDAELADMGLPAESVNGIPPDDLTCFTVHQERMWVSDGLLLYFSELGLPESFAGTSSLNVQSDDGYLIKAVVDFGEILLVMKQSGVYFVAGSDEQSFSVRVLHNRHGCVARDTVAVAEGFAMWFGGDNFYLTDGNRVSAIGNPEVVDLVESISSDDYDLMAAEVNVAEGWYMCSIPESGAITKWVAYNYRSGDWHTMTFDAAVGTPTWMKQIPDSNGKPVVYGPMPARTGHIHQFFSGANDVGSPIACSLRSKNFGFAKEDTMKFMKDIQMLISSTGVAEDIVFTLYRDDDAVAEATKTWNTFGGKMWKRIPLANNGTPGLFMSVAVSYSGDADFDIAGLGFKIVDLGRQAPVI